MLQTDNLMIGNWLDLDGKPVQVERIEQDHIYADNDWFHIERLQPIPVSPDVLEKAGFTHIGDGVYTHKNWITVEYVCKNELMYIDFGSGKIWVKITELHHLQNLIKVHTSKELEINW